jgi:hypothetical protein
MSNDTSMKCVVCEEGTRTIASSRSERFGFMTVFYTCDYCNGEYVDQQLGLVNIALANAYKEDESRHAAEREALVKKASDTAYLLMTKGESGNRGPAHVRDAILALLDSGSQG